MSCITIFFKLSLISSLASSSTVFSQILDVRALLTMISSFETLFFKLILCQKKWEILLILLLNKHRLRWRTLRTGRLEMFCFLAGVLAWFLCIGSMARSMMVWWVIWLRLDLGLGEEVQGLTIFVEV